MAKFTPALLVLCTFLSTVELPAMANLHLLWELAEIFTARAVKSCILGAEGLGFLLSLTPSS